MTLTVNTFIKKYGGTPDFNPEEYTNENIDSDGIPGVKIKLTPKTGYIVRLFWYEEFNQLGVEYEDRTPLSIRAEPKIENF